MRMDKLEPVPYQLFDCVVETPDLFLLTWSGRVAVLQKKDLTQGTADAFRSFWAERARETETLLFSSLEQET